MYGRECKLREKIKCYYSTCKKLMVWIRNSTCMCDSKNQKKQIQTRNEFSIDAQPGNIEKTFFFEEAKSDFKNYS